MHQAVNSSTLSSSSPTVVSRYQERPVQKAIREYCNQNRFNVLVCHRRMGKTVFAINYLIQKILQCPLNRPQGFYFAPTFNQAKSFAWEYLREFTEHIPGMQYNKSELKAIFPNGATITLFSADNCDAFRGNYADMVVIDEYAMMPSRLWSEVVRPALADRNGIEGHKTRALFIGTPAGRNSFYRLFTRAADIEDWGGVKLSVEDTGLIPERELKQLKQEMSVYEYDQELLCSWDAAVRGAYYGEQMKECRSEGRITDVPYDRELPVYTSCDLGIADAFAVVYWQISPGGQFRVIDHDEYHNRSLPEVIAEMRKKPYNLYEMHIAPHDIEVRELGSGMSRLEIAAKSGVNYQKAPNLPIMDGIEATRVLLRKCWFDQTKCADLIDKLSLYRAEVDQKTDMVKTKPLHDFCSHSSDAVRYFAVTMGGRSAGWGGGINYDMLDRMVI